MIAAKVGGFQFFTEQYRWFSRKPFFQYLLLVKIGHSLDICLAVMDLKAYLVVDNTMLRKFAYLC